MWVTMGCVCVPQNQALSATSSVCNTSMCVHIFLAWLRLAWVSVTAFVIDGDNLKHCTCGMCPTNVCTTWHVQHSQTRPRHENTLERRHTHTHAHKMLGFCGNEEALDIRYCSWQGYIHTYIRMYLCTSQMLGTRFHTPLLGRSSGASRVFVASSRVSLPFSMQHCCSNNNNNCQCNTLLTFYFI